VGESVSAGRHRVPVGGNRALREHLGGKRLRFTDQQRRRLAVKAKAIGRKRLFEIGTLVTPDTLLRWHRELIAKKHDGTKNRKPGRPRTEADARYANALRLVRSHGYSLRAAAAST
jgi:hypothetical protein